jgi:hypothetical protein
MSSTCRLSTIGPEGMGFVAGGFTMQHAVGSPKPWRFSLIKSLVDAAPPSNAVKAYWKHVEAPIFLYGKFTLWKRRLGLTIAAFVGRFYSRNP